MGHVLVIGGGPAKQHFLNKVLTF